MFKQSCAINNEPAVLFMPGDLLTHLKVRHNEGMIFGRFEIEKIMATK